MFERNLTRKEVELINQVEKFVREKHRQEEGHDYSHVLAVTEYAIEIAQSISEEVNPFILIIGALFHDLGRVGTHMSMLHGLWGSSLVREYLNATWVSPSDQEKILRIVSRHSPTTMISPQIVEERIVKDADALDRLGLTGILRGIMGKEGSTSDILVDRMQKRLGDYGKLHFEASRQIGEALQLETLEVVSRFRDALDKLAQDLVYISWPVREEISINIPYPHISNAAAEQNIPR